MLKKQILIDVWLEKSPAFGKVVTIICIAGLEQINPEYKRRLEIAHGKKLVKRREDVWVYEKKNNEDTYKFVNKIQSYANLEKIQIQLSEEIKEIVKDFEKAQKEEETNIEAANIIKSFAKWDRVKIQKNIRNFKNKIKNLEPKYLEIIEQTDEVINEKVRSEYTPYTKQKISIYHHIFLNAACNFSVPGAGKTLISLIIFFVFQKLKKVNKLLLVAPLNAYFSWKSEYKKYFENANEEDFFKIEDKIIDQYLKLKEEKIIFINYERLSLNENAIINFLKENDVFLVLDEVHKVRNKSKRTETTKKMLKECRNKLLLTGTPMPKGYEDLITYFENMPTKMIRFTKKSDLKKWKRTPEKYQAEIQKMEKEIEPFYLRISKKDLGLEESSIKDWTSFENDDRHQKIYEIIKNKMIMELENYEDKKKLMEILKARILRLMQVSIDPRMIKTISEKNDEDNNEYDNEGEESEERENYKILEENKINIDEGKLTYEEEKTPNRYNYCFEKVNSLFKEKNIQKIIIWSCWVYAIKKLSEIFKKNNYETRTIYGSTKIQAREECFSDFEKEDGEIQVLICNPATVSESISLHQFCHDAVYFDMTWNALYFMQSKERIHRYTRGKKHNVNYYIIKNKDSIDEDVWESINNKEKRMNKTFESEKVQPVEKTTKHLLEDLIQKYWKKRKFNKN